MFLFLCFFFSLFPPLSHFFCVFLSPQANPRALEKGTNHGKETNYLILLGSAPKRETGKMGRKPVSCEKSAVFSAVFPAKNLRFFLRFFCAKSAPSQNPLILQKRAEKSAEKSAKNLQKNVAFPGPGFSPLFAVSLFGAPLIVLLFADLCAKLLFIFSFVDFLSTDHVLV